MSTETTSTKTVVSTVAAALRTSLSCPVETYRPPATVSDLCVTIYPRSQAEETDLAVGNVFGTGWTLSVHIEHPWDNKATTAEGVIDVEDTIRAWVDTQREIIAGYVMTTGRTEYVGINRPGRADPTFCAMMQLHIDLPRYPGG